MRSRVLRGLVVVWLLFISACTPPECDPNSDQFDPDDCETLLGNFLAYLTWLAYGQMPPEYEPEFTCPADLVCYEPNCVLVQENGSFEVEGEESELALWYGDSVEQTIFPVCHEDGALQFEATTPDGPSASASSQVFQVIDYHSAVPADLRDLMRRIRIQASFAIFIPAAGDDTQFGVRIDAYAGNPSAFPRSGDPESIPTQASGYERLASSSETLIYNLNGAEWQALPASMSIPDETDFLVVFLEAFENVDNENSFEFSNHAVDRVFVAFDVGNTAPVAHPDTRRVPEGRQSSISVIANDFDATNRLDENSVVIVDQPANGDAVVGSEGRVLYTPDSDFVGTDTFTYTVADVEGLVSNVAEVTVTVFDVNEAPEAFDEAYELPQAGLLIVPSGIGVLANDTDPENDELMAELVTDVSEGTLNLDATGAFTYQAGGGFSGFDSFTYRATDGALESNEATVTISAGGYDLSIEKTANPMVVTHSAASTFTVTVRNNGTETAEGVLVEDALDVFGITLQNFTVSQGSYNAETGVWDVGTLAGGSTATLEASALIHVEHTNTATITGGLGENDNPANNEASVTVTIIE